MKECVRGHLNRSILGTVLLVATMAPYLAGPAEAGSLASDDFTSSVGVNTGVVNDAEGPGAGTYTTIFGSHGMSVVTLGGFGIGNVLSLTNANWCYYRPFNGATNFTLNSMATGHTFSLWFSIRMVGNLTSGGADNFSVGFVGDSSSNSIVYANLDLSSAGGTVSEFRYRTGSALMSDAGLIVGGYTWTEPSTVSQSNYTMQLTVTRQTNGFTLGYFRDGVLAGATTQTNGSTWVAAVGNLSISGIAFRHAQVPSAVTYLDNVNVAAPAEQSIPTLSEWAMILLAVLLGATAYRQLQLREVAAPAGV